MPTVLPTKFLHGSAPDRMREDIRAAADALQAALDALQAAAPNARDYTVETWHRAREQHIERLRRVEQTIEELGEVYAEILGWEAAS